MLFLPYKNESNGSVARGAWSPFNEDLNRVFQLFNGGTRQDRTDEAPALDVRETRDAYVVEADLPGMEKKDIQVRVEEGVLTLAGTRTAEHQVETKEGTWHRVERSWGAFERALSLGQGVDAARVSAEYKDGVLTVTVPKKESALPRQVEVR